MKKIDYEVAPRVGAWIETLNVLPLLNLLTSHPVWVRGLKPLLAYQKVYNDLSHPVWVRGLKQIRIYHHLVQYRRTPCGCVD